MKVNDALRQSALPLIDAQLLLAKALACTRVHLFSYPEQELTPTQQAQFETYIAERKEGKPVAYILGQKEFWSLVFEVNESVLVPRPETELLVECVLDKLSKNDHCRVADIGTGSGAIAISLAKERPNWELVATDISEEALNVARKNAQSNQVKNITFFCGDACEALAQQKFHVIVSNPPYIEEDDPHLLGDIRFEPRMALVAREQGLAVIKRIIENAKNHLLPSGWLMLEHGYNQAELVQQLLTEAHYCKMVTINDFNAVPRVTIGCVEG